MSRCAYSTLLVMLSGFLRVNASPTRRDGVDFSDDPSLYCIRRWYPSRIHGRTFITALVMDRSET